MIEADPELFDTLECKLGTLAMGWCSREDSEGEKLIETGYRKLCGS